MILLECLQWAFACSNYTPPHTLRANSYFFPRQSTIFHIAWPSCGAALTTEAKHMLRIHVWSPNHFILPSHHLVQQVKAITLLRPVYEPRHYAQILLAGTIHDKAHAYATAATHLLSKAISLLVSRLLIFLRLLPFAVASLRLCLY